MMEGYLSGRPSDRNLTDRHPDLLVSFLISQKYLKN